MSQKILRYKYVPFNDDSLKIITDGTIKFSAPLEFNDPFDCIPSYDISNTVKGFMTDKELLKRAAKLEGILPAKRIQNKNKMKKNLERSLNSDEFSKQMASGVGICCFSRNPLNLLMWAHYAASHTGFVVEFQIPNEVIYSETEISRYQQDFLYPQKVEYSEMKPVINTADSPATNSTKQFLVKGSDWKYEEEERVIDCLRGAGIHKFDRVKILKSVIAGAKMNDSNFTQLKTVISNLNRELSLNVQVYRAEVSKAEYSLYVPDRNDL